LQLDFSKLLLSIYERYESGKETVTLGEMAL